MGRQWTPQQQKVIQLHHKNVLVSAAAGSGKTAVLVERIIRMITNDEHPVDIDHLVIVTFTNAATAEMRERISNAIEAKLEKQPDNERLLKQLTLVHNAPITTIDSFCLNIVRANFMSLDIDPAFRIADEGELSLMEADVMEEMLEDYYEEGREEFYDLVDSYALGRDDSALEELITKLYRFSRSYPWPKEWLDSCDKAYEMRTPEDFYENPAIEYLFDYIIGILQNYRAKYKELEFVCDEADGPYMYREAVCQDANGIDRMLAAKNMDELARAMLSVEMARLSSKKDADVSAQKRAYVKEVRDHYKKSFAALTKLSIVKPVQESMEDIRRNIQPIHMLIELTKSYLDRMQQKKRAKNVIDFNDMEHLALEVLVHRTANGIEYTQTADDLSEFYEEILIDEYQDSNMLQEQILTSISKGRKDPDNNNIFMVGDVKQSIYKFRLARPDLFIEKYDRYPSEEQGESASTYNCEKIELRKNFRSRDSVLKCINDVFFAVMHKACGKIEYDEQVQLNAGLQFPEAEEKAAHRIHDAVELVLVETKQAALDEDEATVREREGAAIAEKIMELTSPESGTLVYDSALQKYRPAQYSDIVVLTRSVNGWADVYVEMMMNRKIPAFADSSTGYFDTREVDLILNLLAVIDNPIQDIPLTAVVTSYFGTLTLEETALVRGHHKRCKMHRALQLFVEESAKEDDRSGEGGTHDFDPEMIKVHQEIAAKIQKFYDKLTAFRAKAVYMNIHDFIWQLVYDTGFYDYAGTMPSGAVRQANLDMLITKAKSYEGTSFYGVFNFLRYINRLKRYNVDYGSSSLVGENDNLVRVLSIHKSKGLEFPIVIVAGMSKKFNNMDSYGNIVIDADLGIGAVSVDLQERTRISTPIKDAVALKVKLDNLAEELRVLYVAMTRAKEQLIMIGTVPDVEKALAKWPANTSFGLDDLERCNTYFDLVMPVACSEGVTGKFVVTPQYAGADSQVQEHQSDTVEMPAADGGAEQKTLKPYPYQYAVALKSKMTVSEVKRMQNAALLEDSDYADDTEPAIQPLDEEERTVPQFIHKTEELGGADRGTAYHRVMECFDYHNADSVEQVKEELQNQLESGKITEQQFAVINPAKIYNFCKSDLGARVKTAFFNHKIRREQPFVIGVPADDDKMKDETVIIQGVIDLYIEENDSLILVDYKTDQTHKSGSAGEEELRRKYRVQLDYYADTMERLLHRKVKEKLIYSFSLDSYFEV